MSTEQPHLPNLLDAYAAWRSEGLTPLTTIAGYSELLLRGHLGHLTDEQLRAVTIIRQMVSQSLHSWNAYGDYLRVYYRPPLHRAVALTDLITAVTSYFPGDPADITLVLPLVPCTVIGDMQHLQIAVAKLLYPAEYLHQSDKPSGSIRVACHEPNRVTIQVHSPFVASTNEQWLWHHSASLGIATYVIEQHGGTLRVEGGLEATMYEITLPKADSG